MPRANSVSRGLAGNKTKQSWPSRRFTKPKPKPKNEENNIVEKKLKLMYFNTNRLTGESYSELIKIAEDQSPDFMAIAETWLFKEQILKTFPLNNYNSFEIRRSLDDPITGGGILVYTKIITIHDRKLPFRKPE